MPPGSEDDAGTELPPMGPKPTNARLSSILATQSAGESGQGPEAEQLLHIMFDLKGCDGYMSEGLDSTVRGPNVTTEDVASVCAAVNGPNHRACPFGAFWGRLVPPGSIGLVDHNGRIEAVADGRWSLGVYRASWAGVETLQFQNPVDLSGLSIVRVPRGQLGLAKEHGNPVLLGPGLHVYNDINFVFDELRDINTDYFQHGPLHVLRVKRGEYAKVWVSGHGGAMEPKLLQEGCHVVDSSLFSMDGRAKISEAHVSHGSLHILQVPKGSVAKVTREGVPQLLAEGPHYLESTNFTYAGMALLTDRVISHGTISVVRVNRGEVGLAWLDNQPVFLQEPGLYSFDSSTFQYERHVKCTEKIIELGTKKIVTVYSGQVGLSYDRGELAILKPGLHIIQDASHVITGFLSTQQKSVRLRPMGPGLKAAATASDLLVCDTRDLVKVGINADVFYSIDDPEKTIRNVDKDEIEVLVLETAIATLTNIIRSTSLSEIAQSKQVAAASPPKPEDLQTAQALGDQSSAPLFFEKAHDEFISKLHDDFMVRYGINITNIRIESFRIMNEELVKSIAMTALTSAQTESQLANLAGQTEIATREQERQAHVRQINSEAEANAQKTKTEAENNSLVSSAEAKAHAQQVTIETAAKAEATATIERAKAEAEAIRIRAQAEAESIELTAAAEAKRAEMLSATPLGSQLSLLSTYSDMATKSNEGVAKVVYCDLQTSNVGMLGIPTLGGLGRDLEALQKLGPGTTA